MKKTLSKVALLALMACSANTASAQFTDILSKVQSAITNSDNSVVSSLGSVISSKLIPNSVQIVGTWAYKEPAVMFTSDNALKSTASAAMSKQIETKVQSYLSKLGLAAANMTMTFEKDNTFYVTRNAKNIASGTYALTDDDVTLTFKGKSNPCKVTPQLDNGTLVVVMDATKLKTFLEGIGSKVSQLSTITTLMQSMDGMKVGIRMTKQ